MNKVLKLSGFSLSPALNLKIMADSSHVSGSCPCPCSTNEKIFARYGDKDFPISFRSFGERPDELLALLVNFLNTKTISSSVTSSKSDPYFSSSPLSLVMSPASARYRICRVLCTCVLTLLHVECNQGRYSLSPLLIQLRSISLLFP